jgi:hypothetical protein
MVMGHDLEAIENGVRDSKKNPDTHASLAFPVYRNFITSI